MAKRGRPKGSVSLSKQMAESILQFIRAGGFDHVAAEAAGISDRTFRDWMARGEGRHPTRSSTPKLQEFARAVTKAKAEARLAAEVRVYRERPALWLARVARTTQDREGWTEPPEELPLPVVPLQSMTDEELQAARDRLRRAREAEEERRSSESKQSPL